MEYRGGIRHIGGGIGSMVSGSGIWSIGVESEMQVVESGVWYKQGIFVTSTGCSKNEIQKQKSSLHNKPFVGSGHITNICDKDNVVDNDHEGLCWSWYIVMFSC